MAKTKNNQFYLIDGKKYDRVTNIISIIDKPGLRFWQGKIGNEQAKQILQETSDLGSEVHKIIKGLIDGKEKIDWTTLPEDYKWSIKGYFDFLNDTGLEPLKSEMIVYSMLGFAGTLDCMGTIGNSKVILDWKTGNRLYPTNKLQIAAYWAAFRELYPKNIIDRGLVVRLKKVEAKKQYEIQEADDLAKLFDLFLKAYDIYKWQKGGK